MNRRLLLPLLLLLLPARLLAQDAHNLAIGGASVAAPMGIFGMVWNPSQIALPDVSAWTVASGFSAFDTSNTGLPIVHFTPEQALGNSEDPIQRFQQYQGIFGVKYLTFSGGVLYDQELNYLSSQGALQFFNDRANGPIAANASYNLNYQQTTQQVATLMVSYAMPIPAGSLPFFSVGGSLKYHDGLQYQQTSLSGTYTQGVTTGYTYTKTTSTSGLGLSIDLGFFAKVSDSIQLGLMLENIQSSFTWQAEQQNYTLDSLTGAETPSGPATNVNVSTPYPRATKLGGSLTPPGSNINLEGEVSWSEQQTRWSAGLERYYPEANMVVRFGTFADEISNQQLWSFGAGYIAKNFNIDLSFLTRSIPNLQDSIALGGALDAEVRF
jgi:hypothetical protein